MFAIVRAALRAFGIGVVVGLLFAPRPGAETRKLLAARINAAVGDLIDLAGLPSVPPARARTNGHAERLGAKKARTRTDARASS